MPALPSVRSVLRLLAAGLAFVAVAPPARAAGPVDGAGAPPAAPAQAVVSATGSAPAAPLPLREGCGCVRAEPTACCSRWEFTLSLPIWVPTVGGSLASGSTRVDAGDTSNWSPLGWIDNVDVADTATSLEFFFLGGVEARRGRWTIGVEGEHADLAASLDWKVGSGEVDGELGATMARAYVRYEADRWRLGGCGPVLAWGPSVGARLYAVSAAIQGSLVDFDEDAVWLDPTVGLDASLTFRNGAQVRVSADLGGIVTGSDLSWSAVAELRWPLSSHWTLAGGWGWHDIEFDTGPITDRFEIDLRLAGPRLSLGYRF